MKLLTFDTCRLIIKASDKLNNFLTELENIKHFHIQIVFLHVRHCFQRDIHCTYIVYVYISALLHVHVQEQAAIFLHVDVKTLPSIYHCSLYRLSLKSPSLPFTFCLSFEVNLLLNTLHVCCRVDSSRCQW